MKHDMKYSHLCYINNNIIPTLLFRKWFIVKINALNAGEICFDFNSNYLVFSDGE